MTSQGRLECLKKMLKWRIQQMENQDVTINELESHLKKAREDLMQLREKCCGKDQTRHIEFFKYEDKLKQYRDIILEATSHLEKVLLNISNCHDCKKCLCKRMVDEESNFVHCIRKDLESIRIGKNGSDSSNEEKSLHKGRSLIKKSKSLNIVHIEDFRNKSVAGINILEEMKEQVDILHGLVKNYFDQVPNDCEKCQIEECESKFQKLHDEFDCIAESLHELLDSLMWSNNNGENSSGMNRSMDRRSNSPDEKVNQRSEQNQLQWEICEQQNELEKVKNELREAEIIVREKKCRLEEYEKDLESRQGEINKLRTGVKGLRDCLKEMQIEMDDSLTPESSCSSLSVLSGELQELSDMLTLLQPSLPGIIEKYKEENHQLKSTIGCLEKCLENKEQTSVILQKTLKLRDGQIEDLSCKIQSLETLTEKLNQKVCEKTRLIGNLQDSMRKTQDFEMRIKDEYIATLQFEICEVDARLKAALNEIIEKRKDMEILQDEILYVSSKNFFLNREIDLLEPKLGKMQKNLILYETIVCELQKELDSRKCEIEELYQKVKELEEELECEAKKHEQQTISNAACINELNATIRELQMELDCVQSRSRESSPIRSARFERKSNNVCDDTEDPCSTCRLEDEINKIKQRVRQSGQQEELKAIVGCLEETIRRGKCRQQAYKDRINELQKASDERITQHEIIKEKLLQKIRKEELENSKNKTCICRLNENLQSKQTVENNLMETMKKLNCELENVKHENDYLKPTLEKMKRDMKDLRIEIERERDRLVKDFETQKSILNDRCSAFKSELEKEKTNKKCMEKKINELKEMLSWKTRQFQQLSENYKCTSEEAKKALSKLKDSESRLKCMKAAMNGNKCEKNEDDCENSDQQEMQDEYFEDSLMAKIAESNALMNEVECIQNMLKKGKNLQRNSSSSQVKDFNFQDCELARKNAEVSRLEDELDLVEQENCGLRKDIKKLQDELENVSKADTYKKTEIEKMETEIRQLMLDKKSLFESVNELQKKLEEMCIDSTGKEQENRELREQCLKMREQVQKMEMEMCEKKHNFKSLQMECSKLAEQLNCNEKTIGNLKKLCKKNVDDNANLEETRCKMEKELNELKNENALLKEKIQCLKKQKEIEIKKLRAENLCANEEKTKYSCTIKELTYKLKNLEERVIPHLEEEIMRKDRYIENFKMELHDANTSSQRMREESQRVIQCTKKYLGAQKNGNESYRMKSPCQKDNRYNGNNDNRDLEEFKLGKCMSEHLCYEMSNGKHPYQDTEPRSFSPLPWGCPNVERDNSPEYMLESGFQSMQPSPTNMNYSEYGQDMKRSFSQWNSTPKQMENQYSSCRNSTSR